MKLKADKQLIKERFGSSFSRYNKLALVQQGICARIANLMQQLRICEVGTCSDKVPRVFEIGIGTGFLTSRLSLLMPDAKWYLNDIAEEAEKYVAKYVVSSDAEYIWGDAEQISFPQDLDLIATSSTVQWFDDMSNFIKKTHAANAKGGWLVFSTFGKHNFQEILATTGEGLNYYSLPELEEIMTCCGYEVINSEEYIESLSFDTATDVLRHIKATGVNSLRKTRWGKKQLEDFNDSYRQQFSTDDNKVRLTYHPIIIIGKKV